MKLFFCLFLPLLLTAPTVHAKKGTSKKQRLQQRLRKNFFQLNLGYTFWRESHTATNGTGSTGDAALFFQGISFEANYLIPQKRAVRWVYTVSGFSHIGQAAGSVSGGFSSDLTNQSWGHFGVAPGLLYRSGLKSQIGVKLPIGYRTVNWYADDDTEINVDNGSIVTYGLTLFVSNRFTKRSSVVASVTHQHNLKASRWLLAWQLDLR